MELRFKIFRYNPSVDREHYYQTFTLSAQPNERILDCLNRIKWKQDGSLSYRMSCAHGVCGSDAMKINGHCALACQKLVKDYESPEILLEPLPHFKVLKDLVVDLEPFFEKVNRVRPYLIPPASSTDKERKQLPAERKKLDGVIRCILCACCIGACPVVGENPQYLGPAPLVWAFRYIFDSRDDKQIERLKNVDRPDGAWGCVNHFECTRVCPKEILVTKSINFIKGEIEKHLR